MKLCSKCKISKDINEFGISNQTPSGYKPWCNLCNNEYQRARYAKNPEPKRAENREWGSKNRPRFAQYTRKYRSGLTIAERKEHDERNNAGRRKAYKVNPGKVLARNAKRRADRIQATPKWADLKAIEAYYMACPEGYEVDHIVPLKAVDPYSRERVASGLHVLDNLQYLTISVNASKSNKMPTKEELEEHDKKRVR